MWITIRPKWLPRKISGVALACVYLPPSILHEDVDYFYDYFQSCYNILTAESCDTAFIIAGDFNPTCNGFKPRNLNVHCSFFFHGFLASYNWTDVTCASSADDKLEKFLTATNTMINEFFPSKTIRFHSNHKFL